MKIASSFFVCLLLLLCPQISNADTFGSGSNLFNIDFVAIGNPGNMADTSGNPDPAGAVAYDYRMGKYEISEQMINKANAQSALDGDPLGITIDTRGPDKPATRASWFEAAQFVNWLNTSSGSSPAYKFDGNGDFQLWTAGDAGYDSSNAFRNTLAQYFLPSADEWYKAAFYDPVSDSWFDFPNGSDTAPTPVASGTAPNTAVYGQTSSQGPADIMLAGGESPFGTVAQAGNVWEWEETALDLINDDTQEIRSLRGSDWSSSSTNGLSNSFESRNWNSPSLSVGDIGFRIASIPVPESSAILLAISGSSVALLRKRRVPQFDIA